MAPKLPDIEHLLASVSEGITVSDPAQPDLPLIYVNPGFLRMTGYSEAEVLGRNCRFLQGPGSSRSAREQIRQAIAAGEALVTEILNYRKDGSSFWNQLSLTPVCDAEGALKYYVGVQLDVTQRKRLEEMQRDFLDNAAHEFKTPLTIIMGIAETLQRQQSMPQETRESLVQRLLSQSLRLSGLVEDLLQLSAAEALSEKQLTAVSLQDCAAEALADAAPLAELRLVQLDSHLETAPIQLRGDARLLIQLIANLLSNALKHSPAGSRVELSLRREGDSALLSVHDQGPGIAPEELGRIFERFYSLDKARSQEPGSSGLGLAIVRRVAEAHGGNVYVESTPGRGSSFTVRLPVLENA